MSSVGGSALLEAMMMTLILSISLASGLTMVQLTQSEVLLLQRRQHALQELQRAQSELMQVMNRDTLIEWQAALETVTVKHVWHSTRQATFWLAHAELPGEIPVYVELSNADRGEY